MIGITDYIRNDETRYAFGYTGILGKVRLVIPWKGDLHLLYAIIPKNSHKIIIVRGDLVEKVLSDRKELTNELGAVKGPINVRDLLKQKNKLEEKAGVENEWIWIWI